MNNNKSMQIAALLTIAVLAFGTTQFALAKDTDTKNDASLDEINGPGSGEVKTEVRLGDRTKISVQIEDVPRPPNTDDVDACSDYTATIGGEDVPGDFKFDGVTNAEDGLIGCDLDFDDRTNDGDIPSSLTGFVNVTGNGITLTGTLLD